MARTIQVTKAEAQPREMPITVYLNDEELVTIQASPDHLDELAVGFLFGEGLIKSDDRITRLGSNEDKGFVWVELERDSGEPIGPNTEAGPPKRYLTSGCGRGITYATVDDVRRARPINSSLMIEPGVLSDLMSQLLELTPQYKRSGGVHASALCTASKVLFVREDIGRHNTIDKLAGRAYLDKINGHDHILISTGRISYEMVLKASRLGVGIVGSMTAATDLATNLAEELRLEVAGYIRPSKITSFVSVGRVIQEAAVPTLVD